MDNRRSAMLRRSFVPRLEGLEDRTVPSTFTVMNLADSGAGSLRQAVLDANAHPGSTIDFAAGLHGTITLTSGELLISNSVTINGPGANRLSISGNNASRIFAIAANLNVTINDLTITHGHAPTEGGGGILNNGSNLTLSGDDLTQNVAVEGLPFVGVAGGALYSQSGTLTITGCQFTNNQALGSTSLFGIASGGGIEIVEGSATISQSTITGNLARGADNSFEGGGQGGGIDLGGTVLVSHSTISDNRAVGRAKNQGYCIGGGISNFGSLTITDSSLSSNSAVCGNGSSSASAKGAPSSPLARSRSRTAV